MKWISLAIKNMVRRPLRTGLAVLGVGIAVAVLFALMQFQRAYEQGLHAELADLGAHIMIVPRGCPYEAATIVLHGGKWPRYLEEEYHQIIRETPGVADSSPVIMDAIIKDGGRENLIFMGIDDSYPRLRPSWEYEQGGWFDGERTVILGVSAAVKEKVQVGEEIVIEDAPRLQPTRLRVAGILKPTNTQDDGLYFLPMRTVQSLFNLEGKIVVVLVRVADVGVVHEVADAIRERAQEVEASLNVFPLTELVDTLQALLANTRVFVLAIVAVAFLIGGIGVLNTIMMTVYERTYEIGMLKAVGASALDVFRLVWLETLVTCVVGGVVGIGLAMVSSGVVLGLLTRILPYVPSQLALQVSWDAVAVCMVVAVLLGVMAGSYPAYRAASVSPIEAIRGGYR